VNEDDLAGLRAQIHAAHGDEDPTPDDDLPAPGRLERLAFWLAFAVLGFAWMAVAAAGFAAIAHALVDLVVVAWNLGGWR
jgi:hypothetical protein